MIVARPLHPNEPDLLAGNTHLPLCFQSPDGRELERFDAPPKGWTHDSLEVLPKPNSTWEAFLGTQWVGSSEV